MKKTFLIIGFVSLLIFCEGEKLFAQSVLFGVDRNTNELISIDINDASTTTIGTVGGGLLLGLAYDSLNNTMYLNAVFSLYKLSTITGATSLVGSHQLDMTGLTFNSTFTLLYSSRNNDIYTMNPNTGETNLLGATGFTTTGITSFTTSSSGDIYFSKSQSFTNPQEGDIYEVDKLTGISSLLYSDISNEKGAKFNRFFL